MDPNNFKDMRDSFTGRPPNNIVPNAETVEAMNTLRRGIIRRVIIIAAVILIWILVSECVVITKSNEYMAITQFGEVISIISESGLSFKIPLIQTASPLPKDVQFYDMPLSDVITQDKKTMVADSFVLWRVNDPLTFIRKASGSVSQAQSFVSSNSYNSLKNVIGRMPQTEIISGRDTLAQQIFSDLGDFLSSYGVEMVGIETKHLDLPDDNKSAVYDRMISERNNIAAQYTAEGDEEARKIRSETDKQANILMSNATAKAAETIAEGERRYMEILSEAYNDSEKSEFYSFVRALDAAKKSLAGGETTLIIGKDSPIAQIFYLN